MKKLCKLILSVMLACTLLISVMPLKVEAALTEPPIVNDEYVIQRLSELARKLEINDGNLNVGQGVYFTVNGKPCIKPGVGGHGKGDEEKGEADCSNCKNSNVVNAAWFKDLFGNVAIDGFPKQYGTDGKPGGNTGWSCYGFANFALWYATSTQNTDNVIGTLVTTSTFNKENIQRLLRPGYIIRCDGHSMIFLAAGETSIRVMDCNYTFGSYGNCRVEIRDMSYTRYAGRKMAITRAANHESNFNLYLNPNGGSFSDGSTTTAMASPQLVFRGGNWWDVSGYMPTKEGYFFNGWFTDPVGGIRIYDYEGKACNEGRYYSNNLYVNPGDLTVYAQWSKYYDLYLDPNGGSFSNGSTEMTKASPQLIYEGGHWWDVSGYIPTKAGYTFEGWYSQPNGGVKIYNADGTACNEGQYFRDNLYVNQGDLKVYAQWTGREMTFPDVKQSAWYYNSVAVVYEAGWMNGRADGTFGPNLSLTRAEVATVLYNMENKPEVAYTNNFPDVPDQMWYSKPISWAYEKNIVKGYASGQFGVADDITREQMAQMLYAYAKMKNYDVSSTDGIINQYGDSNKVSNWAKPAMNWAITKGIMNGKGSGSDLSNYKLDATGSTSRAECAAMLKNFMDVYVK